MREDLKHLEVMASSADAEERLRSLRLMRDHIAGGCDPGDFLALATTLVADQHNGCRWQALIVVGESILSDPEAVWRVVCEHGESADEDMRDGVATVLLEHLLEYHFDMYFPRVRGRIAAGHPLLADTLRRCHAFGPAVERWGEVEALTRERDNDAGLLET